MWPDTRIIDLLGIELPIFQAPMAGSSGSALAIAVAEAGGLGSLPCATLDPVQARAECGIFRQRTSRPLNLNFFCHRLPEPDTRRDEAWRRKLAPYYAEAGLDPGAQPNAPIRQPFGEAMCAVVEEVRPEVVSFHFGLPATSLLERVRTTGAKVLSSATTVEEARWLDEKGVDAVIAQGSEAGGHRGMFLTDDVRRQPGTFALVPQIVDSVSVPVIAAGGIADARGVVAAFALGAAAVQIGTAYLRTPESLADPIHRRSLEGGQDDSTALTNIFSGRPARAIFNRFMREMGPMNEEAPRFPLAAKFVSPLESKAESEGSSDFSFLLAGQSVALAQAMPAGEFTRKVAAEALGLLNHGLRHQ